MSSRIFSKPYTNSYADLMIKKNNVCVNKMRKNNICDSYYKCNNSPVTILDGKTSYICNNNVVNYICKYNKELYPYGFYLCEKNSCDICI